MKSGFGFPRSARLLTSADYRRVTGSGKKTVSSHFLLFVFTGGLEIEPRLGMTVSKRVGNAVVRNRIKRTLREYFRQHRAGYEANLEFVVIARPRAGDAEKRELANSLARLFAPYDKRGRADF